MSEDIDIKIVLESPPEGYAFPNTLGERGRLKALHKAVEDALAGLGFQFVVQVDKDNPIRRDGSRYYCLLVSYEAHFQDTAGTLRPQLKVELICRPPMIPSQVQTLGYMLEELSGSASPFLFAMNCITVAETLAEKVLSLLRRCAWNWDGHQRGDFDTALVRHVYDVWRIATNQPEAVKSAARVFSSSVSKDVLEFGGQHPEFAADPFGVLRRTLEVAETHEGLKTNFEQKYIQRTGSPDITRGNIHVTLLDRCQSAAEVGQYRMQGGPDKALKLVDQLEG